MELLLTIMKHIKLILTLVFVLVTTNCISYYLGSSSYDSCVSEFYNTEDALNQERKLANALFEMLHCYYEYKDYESIDEQGNLQGHHNFWLDVITETDAYSIADSILGGNWEDFPYAWNNIDSLNYKETITQ